jgi:phosphate transport system permease protein
MAKHKEWWIKTALLSAALIASIGILLITIFVFKEGLPIFRKFSMGSLIFGGQWAPTGGTYGMAPLLAGSIYVTVLAAVIGVPFGIGCAVFLVELAPPLVTKLLRPAISLLAGIPSVVYGFFGLIVLVPFIRNTVGGMGFSLLAGGIILAIMILPTIIAVSEDALRVVPHEYREASLALGATQWQTIYRVLIPAARSGILASIILGMGRAVGETMAVILVTGNRPLLPKFITDPGATLTGTIGQEWAYAGEEHLQALFAVGIVLFALIMLMNLTAQIVRHRGEEA